MKKMVAYAMHGMVLVSIVGVGCFQLLVNGFGFGWAGAFAVVYSLLSVEEFQKVARS